MDDKDLEEKPQMLQKLDRDTVASRLADEQTGVDDDNSEPSSPSEAREPKKADLERQLTGKSIYISQHMSPVRESLFVILICSTQLLTQCGFGQTLIAANNIGPAIGATTQGQLSWTLAAYSLTVGTFVLPAGRLGDIYGSKRMVVVGWLWYGLWSIVTGLTALVTPGQGAVIMYSVAQALRGIGPATMLPNALAIAGKSYPQGRRKNMVFAFFAMCAPTGGSGGAVFGALFTELAWWPWTYWSIGIANIVLGVATMLVVPGEKREDLPRNQRFDYIGSILGVVGLVLVNFAWNQASTVGWANGYVPTLLAVGLLVLVAFYLFEKRTAQPIMPPVVFNTSSVAVLSVVALGWASFGIFFFYIVSIMLNIRGETLLQAAAQIVTVCVSGITAALCTGLLIQRIPAPWMMTISGAAFMAGTCIATFMPAHQIYWAQTFVACIIIPFGMDISFPASTLVLSDMVPKHVQGVAMSLVNTIVNYSISIGLGVAGIAERQVGLKGASQLEGYHAAQYVGVGMATSAFCVAAVFALYTQWRGHDRSTNCIPEKRGG